MWSEMLLKFERVKYVDINSCCCGCIMRTTHGLPCACELARYVIGSIPLDTIISFSDQGLFELKVSIIKEMKTISKRFEELDVCDKVTLKSKFWKIAYPDLNSMCVPPKKIKTKGAQKKQMIKQQRSTKCDLSYQSIWMHYILCKIAIFH